MVNLEQLEEMIAALEPSRTHFEKFEIASSKVHAPAYVVKARYGPGDGVFALGEHEVRMQLGFGSSVYRIEPRRLHAVGEVLGSSIPLEPSVFGITTYPYLNDDPTLGADVNRPDAMQLLKLKGTRHAYPVLFTDGKSANVLAVQGDKVYNVALTLSEREMDSLREELGEPARTTYSAAMAAPLPPAPSAPYIVLESKKPSSDVLWSEPKSIVSHLDEFVISQSRAKKGIAVAFSNYMLRYGTKRDDLPKPYLFIVGPSGSGKTHTVRTLAKRAGMMFVEAKLTSKTPEGYVGDNLSNVLLRLSGEEAPYGVVFLDEVDKLVPGSRIGDLGRKLQEELVGWLDNDCVTIEKGSGHLKEKRTVRTDNLFFVLAGAFYGEGLSLAQIVAKRTGESATGETILHSVTPVDLMNYGIMPELLGRSPGLAVFDPLSKDEVARILVDSVDSPLRGYGEALLLRNYKLRLSSDFPGFMAECCPKETGARALAQLCFELFSEIQYDPAKYAKESVITLTPALAGTLLRTKPRIQQRRGVGFGVSAA